MRIICFVLCAAALCAPSARATVLVPADFGELVRDARAIARGRVVAVEAQWMADHRTIETIVSLEVDAYLKGSFGSIVRFRVPGGVMGRFRNIIAGAPQFELDQRVVVFLGTFGPRVPHLIGFNQGVFQVVPAEGRAGWIVRGERSRSPVPLADFEQRVRDLVGAR
jgi:hypothetical protein